VTRVLVIGAQFPYPPRSGFETRFYNVLVQIAKRHDLTLLTYGDAADRDAAEELRSSFAVEMVERPPRSQAAKRREQALSLASPVPFAARELRSPELQSALDTLAVKGSFDLVQLESALLWGLRLPPGAKLVLDEHNVEYEVFARMRESDRSRLRRSFYRVEEARMERFEQRAWRAADGIVVTSPREDVIVREHAPGVATAVVPNAVDLGYFAPTGTAATPHTLVFNGVLDYRPNVDAVEFLVDDVLPLVRRRHPDVRLSIVGRGDRSAIERFAGQGVEVTGEVPDVRPYLESAAVVVVPIRMGGGTRLKVVEGLALERPMVSTTIGCEGIDVVDGEHLLIADDANGFAAAIGRLFDDEELGRRLGRAGRELMARTYSWDAAGERLDALYRAIL
jgi:glycosyltransferase involved in cell wall biosynthesis